MIYPNCERLQRYFSLRMEIEDPSTAKCYIYRRIIFKFARPINKTWRNQVSHVNYVAMSATIVAAYDFGAVVRRLPRAERK